MKDKTPYKSTNAATKSSTKKRSVHKPADGLVSPTIFLSYAWADKSLARRLARRLHHRGVQVWMDESQMRPGDELPDRIRAAIQSSSYVLVLLTSTSIRSKWVAREIAFARERTPPVALVPVIGEQDVVSPMLENALGIEIAETDRMEEKLDDFVQSILGNLPTEASRDSEALEADLAQLGRELPLLSAIRLCSHESHAAFSSIPIDTSNIHEMETFVAIQWDQAFAEPVGPQGAESASSAPPSMYVALAAADLFRAHSLGYWVLTRFVESCCDRSAVHNVLSRLVSDAQYSDDGVEKVRQLLARCRTSQHIALRWFVLQEFSRLSDAQKQWAIAHLVQRAPMPKNDAIFTAFAFFKLMPQSAALARQWERWVSSGEFDFDGKQAHLDMAAQFFRLMNDADRDRLHQFDHCRTLFQSRMKGLARGRSVREVIAAADLLYEAGNQEYGQLDELCEELSNAVCSAEWEHLALPVAATRAFTELVTAVRDGTETSTRNWVRFHEAIRPTAAAREPSS